MLRDTSEVHTALAATPPAMRVRPEHADAILPFVAWCAENPRILAQGRSIGLTINLSPSMKHLVRIACNEPDSAQQIISNTGDLSS